MNPVRATAEEVVRRVGDGVERVRWDEVDRVDVLTTDEGPFDDDVYYLLAAGESGVAAPSSDADDAFLTDRILALPGFDHDTYILAMGCTDERRFPVWRRQCAAAEVVEAVADAKVLPLPPAPLVLPDPSAFLSDLRRLHRERPYHGWSHIRACLAWMAELHWQRPAEVWAALVFHDAVYEPGAKDNEARSAELARIWLDRTPIDLDRVAAWIELTAGHGVLAKVDDPDAAQLLDVDMAILGASAFDYDRYARGVRAEYGQVPHVAYVAGRGRFLQRLLDAERIFLTDGMHARLDAAARANLRRELDSLGWLGKALA